MDKRGIRYQQAERMTTAEGKVKRLRLENGDLRKALFRAEESARLAGEEVAARAAAQKQSGEALRQQLADARADAAHWESNAEAAWGHNRTFRDTPLWRLAAQRIAARFGRPS